MPTRERLTLKDAHEIAQRREPVYYEFAGMRIRYDRIKEVGMWYDDDGIARPFATLLCEKSTLRTKLRYVERVEDEPLMTGEDADELLACAVDAVLEAGTASTSLLQRKLQIGFTRAEHLIEEMEQRDFIGPQRDGPRLVFITRQQWLSMKERLESTSGFGACPDTSLAIERVT